MSRLPESVLLCVVLFSATPAFSRPNFLDDFRRDPFRRPEVDGCNTCHMSPQGGDARNAFGEAFQKSAMRITPLLRAQFPDRFAYPTSQGGDNLVFHFSDPASRQLVVESAGTRILVDLEGKAVDGVSAGGAIDAAPIAAPKAEVSTSVASIPVDDLAREGAFFGMEIVNLPNGKPVGAGGVDFSIRHRFLQDIESAGLRGLFGFDSSAIVAFGVRVGITDRLNVGFTRSNLGKTIEFSSSFNVVRQGAKSGSPLTLALRGGVEGRDNFNTRYSPFIQPIFTTEFARRVSVLLAPTFAFNTRNEDSVLPPGARYGEEHNHTISLGIGAGVRLLPTTSIVGEYIPRLWGFRGEVKDRPGVSIGLQKATRRHAFELVVSRQEPMTTAQYAVQGTDTFRIGFNIYRKIR
jgi:hypothetical protein